MPAHYEFCKVLEMEQPITQKSRHGHVMVITGISGALAMLKCLLAPSSGRLCLKPNEVGLGRHYCQRIADVYLLIIVVNCSVFMTNTVKLIP